MSSDGAKIAHIRYMAQRGLYAFSYVCEAVMSLYRHFTKYFKISTGKKEWRVTYKFTNLLHLGVFRDAYCAAASFLHLAAQ